jgi:hypothetical protein
MGNSPQRAAGLATRRAARADMEGRSMVTRPARHVTQQELRERSAQATRGVHEALHLPSGRNDATLLRTAIDEVVAQEARDNERFASALRSRYDELARLHSTSAKRTDYRKQRAGLEPLVPLRHTDRTPNSARAPDPRELIWVFGADKLGRALQDFTMDRLKVMADRIQEQRPSTKPKSRASRQALVDYIVAHTPKDIGDWNPSMLPPDYGP